MLSQRLVGVANPVVLPKLFFCEEGSDLVEVDAGLLCNNAVDLYVDNNISEKYTASIFSPKGGGHQRTQKITTDIKSALRTSNLT